MSVLETLGWTPVFGARFEPYEGQGLVPGRVAVQHRGGYILYTEAGELAAGLTGAFRHRAGPGELPAVGDWVVARLSEDGGQATIHATLPRETSFSRKAAGEGRDGEQVLAANVDVVFLVSGVDGDLSLRRLERYLATGWESGARPVIVLTKIDLAEPPLAAVEAIALGVPVHPVSNVTGEGVDELRTYFDGNRTVALLGSSGVGKSSLVNRLAGEELLRTQEVRDDGRGRHTTTQRELVILPEGGLILDTPGLRELQLWDASGGLGETFEEIERLAARCRFRDCGHESEPGCAVKRALADGTLPPERLASFRKLERELEALERRQDRRA